MIFFILLNHIFFIHALTCNEILELPEGRKITVNELRTVQPKDMVQCLAHLGKEQLPKEETDFIWQSIVKYYSGIENIPEKTLMLLHWITPALTPEDYANLTLSSIDVVQNFGLNYGLEEEQLTAIADRVRQDFAGKEPEDYTFYDLTSLRQILCAFNQSEVERIHPSAYREAALTLGKLENCKSEVMQGFAALAVHPKAFGPPAFWTAVVMKTLGNVAQYMPADVVNSFQSNVKN